MKTLTRRVLSLFKSTDLLGHHIHLTLRGNAEVKTYAGAALSLAAVSIFLAITIYTFKEALSTDNPNVLMQESIAREFPPIDLVATNQMPVVLFFNGVVPVVVSEINRYIHVEMALLSIKNVNSTISFMSKQVPLVPCSDLGWESIKRFSTPDSEPVEDLYIMKFGLCPNITDTNVV